VREIAFIQVDAGATDRARRVLKAYAAMLRARMPSAKVTALQEIDRPDRFALLASADRGEGLEAAGNGAASVFRNLQELLVAPLDRRAHEELGPTCAARAASSRGSPLYVIAHLDIAGRDRRQADAALRELARSVCTAPGHLAFDIWRQSNRGNHFDLVASWTSRAQWAAFSSGGGARGFRESVGPLLGSPYDERLYRVLE